MSFFANHVYEPQGSVERHVMFQHRQ